MELIYQTEQAVIECLIQYPDTTKKIADTLNFTNPFVTDIANRILDTAKKMIANGKAISTTTLGMSMDKDVRSVAVQYMAHCTTGTGTPATLHDNLKAVISFAKTRTLGKAIESAGLAISAGTPVEAVSREIIEAVNTIDTIGQCTNVRHISEHMHGAIDLLHKISQNDMSAIGHSTGWKSLDRYWKMRQGEISILGARPSLGKTALSVNMAENQTGAGIPVAYFTAEMNSKNFILRVLCGKIQTSMDNLGDIKQNQLKDLNNHATQLAGLPLWLEDKGNIRADEIASNLYELVRDHDVKIAYVDYLQYIKPPLKDGRYASRENEVSAISSTLKNCAKELNIHICILAQLNREAEGHEPQLSHLRESGAIEQDADIIALLGRARDGDQSRQPTVYIRKNRNGKTGNVEMVFIPERVMFAEKQRGGVDDNTAGWAEQGRRDIY